MLKFECKLVYNLIELFDLRLILYNEGGLLNVDCKFCRFSF